MSSVANPTAVNLFKECYGELHDLQPEDQMIAKAIPYSDKQQVGEKFVEAVVLSAEVGITFGGSTMTAYEINPAIAGSVQQAEVQPYSSILPSILPYGMISRSVGGGKVAFFDATKHTVKNNIKSHGRFQEIVRLYGQSATGLGTVSFASATYRGVAFVNGGGALASTVTGTTITFVGGASAADKAILLAPGQFAAGFWVGMEKVIVQQILISTNAIVAEGQLTGVDALQGIIFVDFTPVAASSVGSHKLVFKGWRDAKEAIGIQKILSTSGTLFGIPTADYSLWKGQSISITNKKFSLEILQNGVAAAVNQGGLDGDLEVYVNPRSWATTVTTEAGARVYDKSYTPREAENGFESITFYHQTGKAVVKAHRMLKEGDVCGLHLPDWSRSGSAEISFKVPGMDGKEEIFPLENQAGYCFRSYSDQYIFCHTPAKSIFWSGINDEATS